MCAASKMLKRLKCAIACVAFLFSWHASAAQTVTTFDVLVATETLTVVGTTTLSGSAFSVGGSSFVVTQGKVGIATASPAGLFTVGNATITVLNSGLVGIGTTTPAGIFHIVGAPISGSVKPQFLWNAGIESLMAGEASGAQWDNTGHYSFILGRNNTNFGDESSVLGGESNVINGSGSTIAGGLDNYVEGSDSMVGGGLSNTAGDVDFVGGGEANVATGGGSVVAGGNENSALGLFSIVGGGGYNRASGYGASILGGGISSGLVDVGNTATGVDSAIMGGQLNLTTGNSSAISGGRENTASGNYSIAAGGKGNTASGDYSFAAGTLSSATAQGSFVWSDSQNLPFVSKFNDEFKVRAQGGFVFYSTWSAPTVVLSSGSLTISTAASSAVASPNIFISSVTGAVGIQTATPASTLDVAGDITALSSVTASAFFGDGSHLTGIENASPWLENGSVILLSTPTDNVVIQSTLTILGNAYSVGGSTLYVRGGFVGIDTTTFLTGGLFHVAAPANTHAYYDFDRESPTFDSAISWASNAYRRWYLGFLPTSGAASVDLTVYNTSAGKVVQTFQDSTGNVGIGAMNPATTLDVDGAAQFGLTGKSTFSASGSLSISPNASLTLSGPSGNLLSGSSITASAFFGDGSHLSGLYNGGFLGGGNTTSIPVWTTTGTLGNSHLDDVSSGTTISANLRVTGQVAAAGTMTVESSTTFKNDSFSVGSSTFVVLGGNVGIGITVGANQVPESYFGGLFAGRHSIRGETICGNTTSAHGVVNEDCFLANTVLSKPVNSLSMTMDGAGLLGSNLIVISTTSPSDGRSYITPRSISYYAGVEAASIPFGVVNMYAWDESVTEGRVVSPTASIRVLPNGHIEAGGSTPGINCSGGGAVSIVGNDGVGRITIGNASTTCAITFHKQWSNAPICIPTTSGALSPRNSASSVTSSTFTFSSGTGTIGYVCFGYQ